MADEGHHGHDLLLIAGFAAQDLTPRDLARAEALVAACPDCRTIAEDLRAIQLATATLPAPERQRDFRLTAADANRLRPHGIREVLAGLALARARPFAAALTTLGVAGLLVSTISFGAPAASAPVLESAGRIDAAGQSPAASDQAIPFSVQGRGDESSIAPLPPTAEQPTDSPERAEAVPRILVAIGSAVLVATGSALFVVARRHRSRFS